MCDIKIKDLLTDESKWTQGCMARDENGLRVVCRSGVACKFCLLGAVYFCYENQEEQYKVLNRLSLHLGETGVVDWNDAPGRTFQEVKDLVERLDV